MAISLIGATIVVFGLAHAKDDPINVFIRAEGYAIGPEQIIALRKKWGLDRPIVLQYLTWLSNIARVDLGRSVGNNRKVTDILRERWPATMQLAVGAWVVGTFVGIPLGILSAMRRASILDYFPSGFRFIRSIRSRVLGWDRGYLGIRGALRVVAGAYFLWQSGR